ncbi:MAG: 30S ribosomal protein S2, partial [Burkholderiales bacterium]|nr:30S ribosomal protein S2 [Burkholderiales bacterium]
MPPRVRVPPCVRGVRVRGPQRPRNATLKGVLMTTMRQMLEAGVHFGHQTRFWNP